MSKFGNGVGLVHKLRQLRRSEELLDCAGNRSDVNQTLRSGFVDFLNSHSFADNSFKSGNTYTELVLKQFAYRTHTTIAQVVDVVGNAYAVFKVYVI